MTLVAEYKMYISLSDTGFVCAASENPVLCRYTMRWSWYTAQSVAGMPSFSLRLSKNAVNLEKSIIVAFLRGILFTQIVHESRGNVKGIQKKRETVQSLFFPLFQFKRAGV